MDSAGSVVEDAVEVAADECAGEAVEWGEVLDDVFDERAAIDGGEAVFVTPPAVGAAELEIDEAAAGLPEFDEGGPAEWDAAEADAVVDERAWPHGDGARGEDAEVEPGRGEEFEVGGIGEEGEGFFRASLYEDLAAEGIGAGRGGEGGG